MNDTAIRLRGMSKHYRVYFEKPALVRSLFPFLFPGKGHHEFWALRDVDLEIRRGECVGVIGPNGAGKSTILSVLAGITDPTVGSVQIDGKTSALLSLGAGFQPELTGRENVYLNAAILGMKRRQVDGIIDRIVDYAGIGEFIEAKLSTYSAGMNMRLGFAIAVNVPFDVLLIDEILAVGDMAFQQKCFKTMREFTEDESRTIVFVSHDLDRIEDICDRVVWLEHGRVRQIGPPQEVIRKYKIAYKREYDVRLAVGRKPRRELTARVVVDGSRELRDIPPTLFGSNIEMFSDGEHLYHYAERRLNPSMLRLIEGLDFKLLRYPGGQNADHFHWQGAVGEKRADQICGGTPAKPRYYPYFGPGEFMEVCRVTGAEPMLTLNAGTGTVEEALAWLSFVRGRYSGTLYLEIGHELYYDEFHNLGRDFNVSPERYARIFEEFAERLKAADGMVKTGIQCCMEIGAFTRYRYPAWNEVVLSRRPDLVDFASVHNASLPILNITPDYATPSDVETYAALLAAPEFVRKGVEMLAAQAQGIAGRPIQIAVSEYGCYFTDIPEFVHGRHRVKDKFPDEIEWGRNRTLAAALFEALVLQTLVKSPEAAYAARHSLFHAAYSSLGRLADDGKFIRFPHYYMQRLYNSLAGKTLVHTEVEAPRFSTTPVGVVPAQENVPCLDVLCAKSRDGRTWAVYAVNRNLDDGVAAFFDVRGLTGKSAAVRTLSGDSYRSSNTQANPDYVHCIENTYDVRELVDEKSGLIRVDLPRHSLSVIVFDETGWI